MTGRLRSLAGQATMLYPGTTTGYLQRVESRRDLAALAPDMARLLADMADALEASDRFCSRSGLCADFPSLLARFRQLEERA